MSVRGGCRHVLDEKELQRLLQEDVEAERDAGSLEETGAGCRAVAQSSFQVILSARMRNVRIPSIS